MADIFIGYRRGDAPGTAGRLYDRFAKHYGRRRVFRDVDAIPAGSDFVDQIEDALAATAATLIIIGPRWLTIQDEGGNRRLDLPRDYVRLEVEWALQRPDHAVIPVLVDGAPMPKAEQLPESIRALARRDAVEIRNERFDADVQALLGQIAARPGLRGWLRTHPTGSALGLLAIVAAAAWLMGWVVSRGPEPLVGDFNVAIAELAATDGESRDVAATVSEAVFSSVTNNLATFEEAGDLRNLDAAGPEDVGSINGERFDERTAAAGELAAQIDADVVLYGSLDTSEGITSFGAEFFLSDRNLTNAEELSGGYALPLVEVAAVDPISVTREVTHVVERQSTAVAELLVGLSYYGLEQPEMALSHFESAEAAWATDEAGKEVVFHLMGNATGQLGPDRWPEARDYYLTALDIDHTYARAMFGITELRYQEHKGPHCGVGSETFNEQELRAAIREFETIATLEAPPLSHLDVRSELEIGKILLCLAISGEADVRGGRTQVERVIADIAGVARLRPLVANAYETLAGIQIVDRQPELAIDAYREAIDVVIDAEKRALFYGAIGWIYECMLGDSIAADDEYAASEEQSRLAEMEEIARKDCP